MTDIPIQCTMNHYIGRRTVFCLFVSPLSYFRKESTMKAVSRSVNRIGVVLAVLSLTLILGGCDAPKPKSFVIDTSLELDRTFEEPDYGFQFSYPGTFPFEEGQGIFSKGTATLYFSPDQKLDSSPAMIPKTKALCVTPRSVAAVWD